MTKSKLAMLEPARKSAIVRSRIAEICAAYSRGCTYEEIAQVLEEESGLNITGKVLAIYVERERKKQRAYAQANSLDIPQPVAANTEPIAEAKTEQAAVNENAAPSTATTASGNPLTFGDVDKLMRTPVNPDQYSRKRNR